MLAYRQNLVIDNPYTVVLHDLPLQVGQSVEVLVLVNDNADKPPTLNVLSEQDKKTEIKQLLDKTRGCLTKKTTEELDKEIAAMRQEWVREWE